MNSSISEILTSVIKKHKKISSGHDDCEGVESATIRLAQCRGIDGSITGFEPKGQPTRIDIIACQFTENHSWVPLTENLAGEKR